MSDIADLIAKLDAHDPADDLQWLSGGVDRVLANNERSIALGRLRERIDFWLEVWPELRAIVVAAQAWEKAYEGLADSANEYDFELRKRALNDSAFRLRAAVRGEA